jgi:hypothetical protein
VRLEIASGRHDDNALDCLAEKWLEVVNVAGDEMRRPRFDDLRG